MSSDESPELRQKLEFEALTAIYGEDLKDLRKKSAWNRWTPLNISISLIPQQGSSGLQEAHAKVNLHVTCTESYPNSVPNISLENGKGLSNNALIQLKQELESKALMLKGHEMIFELAQHTQEFLHKHNKPSSKSFYEEMLQREREMLAQENAKKQEQQIKINRERQFMMEEIEKRQEIQKQEYRPVRRHRFNSEHSEDSEKSSQNNSFSDGCNEKICDVHRGSVVLEFGSKDILRGSCISHLSKSNVIYSSIDKSAGEMVLLAEWIFDSDGPNSIVRQVGNVENEFHYLTKLKHQNLSNYLDFKWELDNKNTIVHILEDFIYGSNCSFFIKQNICCGNVPLVRYIANGVLSALDYLHRNNVVHKDVRAACVFINEKGNVILSKYSLYRRLSDLSSPTPYTTNYNKKTDILKFGAFLLALLTGLPVVNEGEDIDIPTSMSSDLYDFLKRCTCKNEKERYTTAQLLSHPFIVTSTVDRSPLHDKFNKEILPIRNTSPDDLGQADFLKLSQAHKFEHSRISNEFEFIQNLGKGAFGDVFKARNNLDGGYYAIKRIRLNPKNQKLNRKIVREVKLLSRLNHENVVRYFNSWIETMKVPKEEDSDLSVTTTSGFNENLPRVVKNSDLTINDNIEELAPSIRNAEISVTYDSKSQPAYNANLTDEESSDEEENWGVFNEESDSDEILFKGSENAESVRESSEINTSTSNITKRSPSPREKQVDFMYIQMEFCEKSTLRSAIDDNLWQDEDRVWRLFREIIEGLAYIHQQGMIHRDLKPVNIFLDCDDHVKIGDFGLATTSIKSRLNEYIFPKTESDREDTVDESKTGFIGTALYVAPELGVASKAIYNQKVDIYSLGVIFFEMCYKPLPTNMERIKILTGLRMKDIQLPPDFMELDNSKQKIIIRWLLNHDVSERPTSKELLQSEHIPPPVVEERELRELIRHTLSNPQLKGYKYLIATCFNQSLTPAQDITYDRDPSAPNITKHIQLYEFIKQATVKVFMQHGGQNLSTPLLMPISKYYDKVESCVKLMTHFGGIVSLPHDLRAPFARYVAWNGITFFRRYSVERVYREKKVYGFTPRELYECAFDIVTPTPGTLLNDAEILCIVHEIFNELPEIRNKHILVRLNHALLLKAIMSHFGIKKPEDFLEMISDLKEGKLARFEIQKFLSRFGISDNTFSAVFNIFNSEFEISKAVNQFQMITKKKTGEATTWAKQALHDLKSIIQHAESFGVTFDIVVAPGYTYNIQQYSGMICQFVCELKKSKHGNMDVLAAGGRYDSMIASYRNILQDASMLSKGVTHQSAVGISISLDKIVQAIQKQQDDDRFLNDYLDITVCSVGSKPLLKEKIKMMKNLWAAGFRASLAEANNIEEVKEQSAAMKICHIVMLKDSDQSTVRLLSWERDRYQEKTFRTTEVIEHLIRISKSAKEAMEKETTSLCVGSKMDISKMSDKNDETNVTVLFSTIEKLSSAFKKRYEVQITSQLDGLFKKLSGYVTVVAVNLDINILRTVAVYLEFDSEQQFQRSLTNVIEKHQRHKKYLSDLGDDIYEQKLKRTNPTIVLYSLTDSKYIVLL